MFKRSIALLAFVSLLHPRPASAQLLSGLLGGLTGTSTSSTWSSPKADDPTEAAVRAGKSLRVIIRYKPEYQSVVVAAIKYKKISKYAELRGSNAVAIDLTASNIK